MAWTSAQSVFCPHECVTHSVPGYTRLWMTTSTENNIKIGKAKSTCHQVTCALQRRFPLRFFTLSVFMFLYRYISSFFFLLCFYFLLLFRIDIFHALAALAQCSHTARQHIKFREQWHTRPVANDNPFNDLLHRVENYDIELLEYVAQQQACSLRRVWEEEWRRKRVREAQKLLAKYEILWQHI